MLSQCVTICHTEARLSGTSVLARDAYHIALPENRILEAPKTSFARLLRSQKESLEMGRRCWGAYASSRVVFGVSPNTVSGGTPEIARK